MALRRTEVEERKRKLHLYTGVMSNESRQAVAWWEVGRASEKRDEKNVVLYFTLLAF